MTRDTTAHLISLIQLIKELQLVGRSIPAVTPRQIRKLRQAGAEGSDDDLATSLRLAARFKSKLVRFPVVPDYVIRAELLSSDGEISYQAGLPDLGKDVDATLLEAVTRGLLLQRATSHHQFAEYVRADSRVVEVRRCQLGGEQALVVFLHPSEGDVELPFLSQLLTTPCLVYSLLPAAHELLDADHPSANAGRQLAQDRAVLTSPYSNDLLRRCYELQTRGAPELHLGQRSVSAFLRGKEDIDSRIDRDNSDDVVVFEAGVPGCVLYADLLPLPLSVAATEQQSDEKDRIVGDFTLRRQGRNSTPREFSIIEDDGSAAHHQACRELVVRGLVESAKLWRTDDFIYERPDGLFVQHRHYKTTSRSGEEVMSSLLTPDLRVRCEGGKQPAESARFYSVTPAGCTFLERAQNSDDSADPVTLQSDRAREITATKRVVRDFRSFCWGNTTYSFTATQAAIVKILHSAWQAGEPDVGHETLLGAAGSEAKRLRDVFRTHRNWQTVIVSGATKGSFRLKDLPKN